jgi:type IV secretion system protein VirB2
VNTLLKWFKYAFVIFIGLLCIVPEFALAQSGDPLLDMALGDLAGAAIALGQGMPWDRALSTLVNSLTGNTATSIGVIAIAAAGGTLVFGGEVSEFAKRLCMLILALSMLMLAARVMSGLGLIGDPRIALAAGDGLPWEGPLVRIQRSLTGPTARAIGIIAISVTGAMLAFGGELSDFGKRMCMLVMAISVMLAASGVVNMIG